MKLTFSFLILLVLQIPASVLAATPIVDALLKQYQAQGALSPDAEKARQLWVTGFPGQGEPQQRSCSSCHGVDLTKDGKHIKTGKSIKAMSPEVNKDRLTNQSTIEKWFKRNCNWTFGRECTPQEKADFLLYLSNPVIF
jgi:hypothetical protein